MNFINWKKPDFVNVVAIAAIFFLIGGCDFQNSAQGKKLNVHPNSVFDFGAVGDSITDDTKAIQKAIDSGNGHIVFSPGTYRITRPIVINLDKTGPVAIEGGGTARVIMEGEGPAFKFVGTHKGSANPTSFEPGVLHSQRMPMVDGLEIIGNNPKAVGIEAAGTMELTITRVLVQKALHGIHLTNRNRNVTISECHLYWNHGIGIYLDDVNLHQIDIVNNHISYNGGGGIVVRKGEVRNMQIGSCDIEANMDKTGPPTANVLIDITEGSMLEGAIVGCTIQHTSNAPESANIRFIGHSGEDRKKAGNFTIANNALSDAKYNIHAIHSRGLIITGNTFWKGYTNNILIQETDQINLGTNLLDRNPDYKAPNSRNNVIIEKSNNILINGLQLNNAVGSPGGIVLNQCRNYNITNSSILNCEGPAILLLESINGKVSGNFISTDHTAGGKQTAIQVSKGQSNLIINNYTNGIIKGNPKGSKIINNYFY